MMKKLLSILMCALMLAGMMIPMAADESEDFKEGIGQISCPFGTPSLDGVISDSEGWSSKQPINSENTDGGWGVLPVEVEGGIWRAYDENNLYIAAEILLPEISLSEGEDWIDGGETGNMPGWDGDVFIFTLDPLNKLRDAGYLSDTSVWYCFGIFEGDVIRTYRTHANDGEVTDIIPAKGKLTDGGWVFEAAIPWETICQDINAVSFGEVEMTPDEVLSADSEVTCAMIYYDRRHDPEAGERITYHRYVTIATTCIDGTQGIMATPWKINAYGINLLLEPKPADTTAAPETTTASPETTTAEEVTEVVTDNKGNAVTDNKGNKVTQKVTTKTTTKKATTSTSTGGNAAQTFDIGIATAIGAIAVSGIGFVATKKKR